MHRLGPDLAATAGRRRPARPNNTGLDGGRCVHARRRRRSATAYTTTQCQTISTGPTPVASCTASPANSGNAYTTTTCAHGRRPALDERGHLHAGRRELRQRLRRDALPDRERRPGGGLDLHAQRAERRWPGRDLQHRPDGTDRSGLVHAANRQRRQRLRDHHLRHQQHRSDARRRVHGVGPDRRATPGPPRPARPPSSVRPRWRAARPRLPVRSTATRRRPATPTTTGPTAGVVLHADRAHRRQRLHDDVVPRPPHRAPRRWRAARRAARPAAIPGRTRPATRSIPARPWPRPARPSLRPRATATRRPAAPPSTPGPRP